MKLVASIALCLCLARVASAQAAPPGIQLQLPAVQQTNRAYRLTAISLAAGGAALILTGGLLWGLHDQSDGRLDSGIVMTGVGGATLFSSLWVGLNTAGRDAGLRQLRLISDAAPTDQRALLDDVESRARHSERIGMGLFLGGLALFAGGTAMAIIGLGNPLEHNDSGNMGMFGIGVALSVSGDALWATGAALWTYEAGKHSALRQGHGTLAVLPTGVAGTF
jgi:hypothetical protein